MIHYFCFTGHLPGDETVGKAKTIFCLEEKHSNFKISISHFMALVSTGEFLTLNQVVDQYDISLRKIYNLREQGRLVFHKLGKKSYVRKSEFEGLMQMELPQFPQQQ